MTELQDKGKHQNISSTQALGVSRTLGAFFKRGFDLLASGFGLLFIWPLFALVAVLIKRDSPGPVFYRATRVGRYGQPFPMLKFRTMYEQPPDNNGPPLTACDDGRITPIGKWLRATKLNELPQLVNVFKGQMSLVGPRPEDPAFVAAWPEDVRHKVLSVRPGITSPASVVYRDEEQLLSGKGFIDAYLEKILPDKLRLDQLYVDNYSIITDLDVIFMTLLAILPRLRRVNLREHWLYAGPLYTASHKLARWFVLDLFVVLFTMGLTGIIWRVNMPLNIGLDCFALVVTVTAVMISLVNAVFSLHHINWLKASPTYVLDLGVSVFFSSLVLWFLGGQFDLLIPALPFAFYWLAGLMTLLGLVAVRYRERLVTGLANRWVLMRGTRASFGERVLVVGAGELGELAVWMLSRTAFPDLFTVVGLVDDDPRKQRNEVFSVKVIGTTRELPELVERHQVGLVVVAIANASGEEEQRLLSACQVEGVQVVVVPDLIKVLRDAFADLESGDDESF